MSGTFWVRMVLVVPGSVLLHLVIGSQISLLNDVGGVGAFVTAVGTLYSVLTAFTVVSVWTEFTATDRAIKQEARDLSELWRYVGYVSDSAGVDRAREAIERYRDDVVGAEWTLMAARVRADAAEDEFFAMADAVNAIEVRTPRDVPAWAEAVRTLGAVSDARGERVLLVALRMPRLLRLLLYLATFSLVGGMILLGFDNPYVGSLVVAFTAAVSLLVLEVIDDIDDPIGGAWGISMQPFADIRFGRAQRKAAGEGFESRPPEGQSTEATPPSPGH